MSLQRILYRTLVPFLTSQWHLLVHLFAQRLHARWRARIAFDISCAISSYGRHFLCGLLRRL